MAWPFQRGALIHEYLWPSSSALMSVLVPTVLVYVIENEVVLVVVSLSR
jgi:hypothetical protein